MLQVGTYGGPHENFSRVGVRGRNILRRNLPEWLGPVTGIFMCVALVSVRGRGRTDDLGDIISEHIERRAAELGQTLAAFDAIDGTQFQLDGPDSTARDRASSALQLGAPPRESE